VSRGHRRMLWGGAGKERWGRGGQCDRKWGNRGGASRGVMRREGGGGGRGWESERVKGTGERDQVQRGTRVELGNSRA